MDLKMNSTVDAIKYAKKFQPDYNDHRVSYQCITELVEINMDGMMFDEYDDLYYLKHAIERIQSLIDNRHVYGRIHHHPRWDTFSYGIFCLDIDGMYYKKSIRDMLCGYDDYSIVGLEDKATIIAILKAGVKPFVIDESGLQYLAYII
jgi:hypothetical protein